MKNLTIGILLGIFLMLTAGSKVYQTIVQFRIVKDHQDRAVLVNMEAGTATYIRFLQARQPTLTLILSDNWSEASSD